MHLRQLMGRMVMQWWNMSMIMQTMKWIQRLILMQMSRDTLMMKWNSSNRF
uniref:Uncharacterized protein n=1 Tax=Arundo donax TaxID=35708 RepID=A0A0A9AZI4_ARUDO